MFLKEYRSFNRCLICLESLITRNSDIVCYTGQRSIKNLDKRYFRNSFNIIILLDIKIPNN